MSHPFNQITPTDKFGWHRALLPVYARLFAPLKDKGLPVLEIGTDGGGGLLMYADYFYKSLIVGMDVSPAPEVIKGRHRVTHYQLDAYSPAASAIEKLGPFGVMIDDGPHTIDSQRHFCQHYPKLLADEGIAICEDVQDPKQILLLEDATPDRFETMVIDVRHVNGRYDDLLFVIWKP